MCQDLYFKSVPKWHVCTSKFEKLCSRRQRENSWGHSFSSSLGRGYRDGLSISSAIALRLHRDRIREEGLKRPSLETLRNSVPSEKLSPSQGNERSSKGISNNVSGADNKGTFASQSRAGYLLICRTYMVMLVLALEYEAVCKFLEELVSVSPELRNIGKNRDCARLWSCKFFLWELSWSSLWQQCEKGLPCSMGRRWDNQFPTQSVSVLYDLGSYTKQDVCAAPVAPWDGS